MLPGERAGNKGKRARARALSIARFRGVTHDPPDDAHSLDPGNTPRGVDSVTGKLHRNRISQHPHAASLDSADHAQFCNYAFLLGGDAQNTCMVLGCRVAAGRRRAQRRFAQFDPDFDAFSPSRCPPRCLARHCRLGCRRVRCCGAREGRHRQSGDASPSKRSYGGHTVLAYTRSIKRALSGGPGDGCIRPNLPRTSSAVPAPTSAARAAATLPIQRHANLPPRAAAT